MQVQGLPHPRAGSEYNDLHAHGADRYAPTDLRAFATRVDLITASEYEYELRAYGAGHYVPTAVGGWGSPVGGFPPCGVSPRGVWGLPPSGSFVARCC